MDDARARSLLESVLAAPADDAARLVYADHLIERGDPHGELIQVECALATLPATDPRRVELGERLRVLRLAVYPRIAPLVEHATFTTRRGFLDTVELDAQAVPRLIGPLLAAHPVRRLAILVRDDADVDHVAALALPPALEVALIGDSRTALPLALDRPAAARVFEARRLVQLENVTAPAEGWLALLAAPACARARTLDLGLSEVPARVIAALADPAMMPALVDLDLRTTFDLALTPDDLAAIGARLERLAELAWSRADALRDNLIALLSRASLLELDYRRTTATRAILDALAASPSAVSLRALGVWIDGPALLAEILDAPHLRDLAHLHLEPVPEPSDLAELARIVRAHVGRPLVIHWDRAPLALRETAPTLFAVPPPRSNQRGQTRPLRR